MCPEENMFCYGPVLWKFLSLKYNTRQFIDDYSFTRTMLATTLTVLFAFTSAFAEPQVRCVTESLEHLEGPSWDPRVNRLYFVDIFKNRVYSYDPEKKRTTYAKLPQPVTIIVPSINDTRKFAVSQNRSIVEIDWDGRNAIKSEKLVAVVSEEFPQSNINDGKADSHGRLWFGTCGPETSIGFVPYEGSLYMLQKNKATRQFTPVTLSNGLTWNKANTKFYYVDSMSYKILEFELDEPTGNISNPREVVNLRTSVGLDAVPDGMTVDANGKLWVALYGGGAVLKVNPLSGVVEQTVKIPSKYVTSVAWGGKALDVLYVTTSKLKLNEAQRRQQPGAGCVFAVKNLGTMGLPAFEVDLS